MTEITPYQALPAKLPKTKSVRSNLLVLATCLVSAAVFSGYIALVGFYVKERAAVIKSGEVWLPDGVNIPLTQPNYLGLTIFFSFITVWWAVSAIRADDRNNTYLAVGLTLVFGVAFLMQSAYLLDILNMAASNQRAILIFTLVGVHMFIMVAAMAYLIVVGLRTMSGEYSSVNYEGVLGSAIFWTLACVIYAVLWYTIYITK